MKWRGHTAVYTPAERQIMRLLPVKEQAFVHLLKAFTDGEISDGLKGAVLSSSQVQPSAPALQAVYTDPEDIPFGKPKRRPKTYALVWTWQSHRVYKTKGKAQAKLKVWKKWYERQGWKVNSHASGYFAAKDGVRHSIALHEYDRETKERLA